MVGAPGGVAIGIILVHQRHVVSGSEHAVGTGIDDRHVHRVDALAATVGKGEFERLPLRNLRRVDVGGDLVGVQLGKVDAFIGGNAEEARAPDLDHVIGGGRGPTRDVALVGDGLLTCCHGNQRRLEAAVGDVFAVRLAEVVGGDREVGRRGGRADRRGVGHAVQSGIDRGLGALDRDGGVRRAIPGKERQASRLLQRQGPQIDRDSGLNDGGGRGVIGQLHGVAVGAGENQRRRRHELVGRQQVDRRMIERRNAAVDGRRGSAAVAVVDGVGERRRAGVAGVGREGQVLVGIEGDQATGDRDTGITGRDRRAVDGGDGERECIEIGIIAEHAERDRQIRGRGEGIAVGDRWRVDGQGDGLEAG